jgi:DMSO/TMAO reductase YedYZ heme-binding membrane subunit
VGSVLLGFACLLAIMLLSAALVPALWEMHQRIPALLALIAFIWPWTGSGLVALQPLVGAG